MSDDDPLGGDDDSDQFDSGATPDDEPFDASAPVGGDPLDHSDEGPDSDDDADGKAGWRERVRAAVVAPFSDSDDERETDDGDDNNLRVRLSEHGRAAAARVRAASATAAEEAGPACARLREGAETTRERLAPLLTSTGAKKCYAVLAVLVASVVGFKLLVDSRGLMAAVLYSILFVFTATLCPILINLLGGASPNSLGKLHLLLGAVAFNHHYLVQRDHGWEWCPGDRGRVWIDEEWHEVSGEQNYSVLAWRPFGILRYKDDETWAQQRADTAGQKARGGFEQDPTTGGNDGQIVRGGFPEAERPSISGLNGTWLLDLKRVFTNGIRKIGDVELIETAEEIIERRQVNDGTMSSAGPLVETIGGLLLGILAGYGYIFLSG